MLTNYKDEIAVLVSQDFGAGWSTWNLDYPECLFDADIARMVLREEPVTAIIARATEKWPNGYWGGGADGLAVHWLTPGTRFRINVEYDGRETLTTKDDWLTVPTTERGE